MNTSGGFLVTKIKQLGDRIFERMEMITPPIFMLFFPMPSAFWYSLFFCHLKCL